MGHLGRFRASSSSTIIVLFILVSSLTVRGGEATASGIYDPIRTFNAVDGYAAAQFGMALRADKVLIRGTAATDPPPLWTWVNGDYGEDKGRNYLEAGVGTGFVLRKHSRYPLLVTIPINTAVGDEEYMFGQHFAYVTTGVNVRVQLSFLPTRFGRWTAGTSADLCYYGTTATQFLHSVGPQLPKVAAVLSVEL